MGRLATVLRGISQFPKTLDDLVQVLSRFESNISAAIESLDRDKADAMWVTARIDRETQLKIGEIAVVDTSAGNVSVYLPIATTGNQNRTCGVIHTGSTNAVQVRSRGQLVQGSAYDSLTAIGFSTYISTGLGWYR
jgi:hypothetical protein